MQNLIKLILVNLCLCSSFIVQADAITGINFEMAKAGEALRDIYPLIVKQSNKIDESEKQFLLNHVKDLKNHINKSARNMGRPSATFKISYHTISKHLDKSLNALANQNINYAQSLLRSTINLCVSCHIQDQNDRFITQNQLKITLTNPIDEADYYFTTRHYTKALAIYQQILTSMETLDWKDDTLEALERVLSIYIKVKRKPQEAYHYFDDLLQQKLSDKNVYSDLSQWLLGIKTVIDDELPNHIGDFKTLEKFVKHYVFKNSNYNKNPKAEYIILSEKDRVPAIWIRSLAHNYLNGLSTSDETPKILYWLAIIDRSLEYDMHYSLASLYLEQCIMSYSNHPYAQKCYDLYREYVTFSYTGSRGTFLPQEVEQELIELKAYIKPHNT